MVFVFPLWNSTFFIQILFILYKKRCFSIFYLPQRQLKKFSHLIKILHYLFYWCGTSIRSQLYYTDSILFRNFLFLIWILYFIAPLHQRMYICGCKIFNVELQSLFDVNLSVWQTILSFPWLLRFAALDLSQPEPQRLTVRYRGVSVSSFIQRTLR